MDIELTDAVAALRDELLEAAARGADQNIAFQVGPVEMEFAVELRADGKGRFGFKAWVVSADVEAGVSRGRTQRVKLTLTPTQPGGGPLLIHGDPRRQPGPGNVSDRITD